MKGIPSDRKTEIEASWREWIDQKVKRECGSHCPPPFTYRVN